MNSVCSFLTHGSISTVILIQNIARHWSCNTNFASEGLMTSLTLTLTKHTSTGDTVYVNVGLCSSEAMPTFVKPAFPDLAGSLNQHGDPGDGGPHIYGVPISTGFPYLRGPHITGFHISGSPNPKNRNGNWLLGMGTRTLNSREGSGWEGRCLYAIKNGWVGFPPGFDDSSAKSLCSEVRDNTVASVKTSWSRVKMKFPIIQSTCYRWFYLFGSRGTNSKIKAIINCTCSSKQPIYLSMLGE